MKRIVFCIFILSALLFTACGNKTEEKQAITKDFIDLEVEPTTPITTIEIEEITDTPKKEEVTKFEIPDINNYWKKDLNYLDLKQYLYDCGASKIEEECFRSAKPTSYIVTIGNYRIDISTIECGQDRNLILGDSKTENNYAFYNFDYIEHQIMMTIVDEENSILIHTETLEILPELIEAIVNSPDEIPKLDNYTYL